MAEVYATFYDGHGSTYLVMEHIDAVSFRVWIEGSADEQERGERTATAVTAITEAVAWLLTCPLPDPRRIGPVGGGCMFHCFYGMGQAPVPFVDAAALEEHVNEALRRRPRRPTDRVSLANEPVMFTHSDITFDNFLWDPSTQRIWFIDCQDINVLPASFFSFYLHRWSRTDPLVRAVAAALDFPVSEKLRLLLCRVGTRRLASTRTETIHGASPLPVHRIRICVRRCQ
ncbi:hypothetical protein C8R45DRAFT_569196 [Mycena sanguinolenta]|nr:hypothetical protein C8R45DRAFT_569196 [Mycena sanguinolenta]